MLLRVLRWMFLVEAFAGWFGCFLGGIEVLVGLVYLILLGTGFRVFGVLFGFWCVGY